MDSSPDINVSKFELELEELIAKHYGGGNGTVLSDEVEEGGDGFFLVFLRKMPLNETKETWIRARTFGLNMTVGQIENAFTDTIERIMDSTAKGGKPIPIA